MNSCEVVQDQLSAFLDEELSASESQAVQSHLDACGDCREVYNQLAELDGRLQQWLRVEVPAERQVCRAANQPHDPMSSTRRERSMLAWLVGIAASFLFLSFSIYHASRVPPETSPPTVPDIAATLIGSTGPIEVMDAESRSWKSVSPARRADLTAGSRLRTAASVRCEVQTRDQGVIRLDEKAELVFHDATNVELRKGRMWCEAPKEVQINVEIPVVNNAAKIASFACPSDSSIHCSAAPVSASWTSSAKPDGRLCVEFGSEECLIAPGESAVLDSHESVQRNDDLIAEASVWQLPLMVVSPRNEQELTQTISRLLAPIGYTKLRHFNEEQIRRLGPAGAIPLFAFVQQSGNAPDQLSMRQQAMRIACEIADDRSLVALKALASDVDPIIARYAERAVKRLQAKG